MLGNLKNPPEPFGEIIRTHYRLKAKSISAQLDEWLAKDDNKITTGDGAGLSSGPAVGEGGSSNGLKNDVDEVKLLLKQLEAGVFSSSSGV